ncbi:hypothetical protein [Vibrio vulnificus]|uniref:hypothetical protein n=1 Tax=Vibrio vulnificus TaxID=672 RepID=UPI000CD216D2|nr:hypothetical protein [Vibrio vulnificus]POC19546.1 hypothetical protein CRN42_13545 [Vibrio vulnificus]
MSSRNSQEILLPLLTKELARLEKKLTALKAKLKQPDLDEIQKLRTKSFELQGQAFLDAFKKLEVEEAKYDKWLSQDFSKHLDQEFDLEREIKTVKGLIRSVESKCALGMFIR